MEHSTTFNKIVCSWQGKQKISSKMHPKCIRNAYFF